MKKIFAQIVYGFNFLIFVVSIGLFFLASYALLSGGSIVTQQGIAVWNMRIIVATIIPIIVPIVSFFLVRTLGRLIEQEKFTETYIFGLLGLFGILGTLFVFIIQLSVIGFM